MAPRERSLERRESRTGRIREIDGQDVVIPIEVVHAAPNSSDSQSRDVCRIVPGTLRVNEPLDDSLFKIARTSATEVYDLDTGIVVNQKTGDEWRMDVDGNPIDPVSEAGVELAPNHRRGVFGLVIANGLVIMALCIGYFYRRRKGIQRPQ